MSRARQGRAVQASSATAVLIAMIAATASSARLGPLAPASAELANAALAALRSTMTWIGLSGVAVGLLSMHVMAISRSLALLRSLLIRQALGADRRELSRVLRRQLLDPALRGAAWGLVAGAAVLPMLVASWPPLFASPDLVWHAIAAGAAVTAVAALSLWLVIWLTIIAVERGIAGRMGGLAGDHVTASRKMVRAQSGLVSVQLAVLLVVTHGAALMLRNSAMLTPSRERPAPDTRSVAHVILAPDLSALQRAAAIRHLIGGLGPDAQLTSADALLEFGRRTSVSGLCVGCFLGDVPLPATEVRVIATVITSADTIGATPVAVLNHIASDTVFPQGHAVGSRLRITWDSAGRRVVRAIVRTRAPRALGNRVNEPPLAFVSILQDPPATLDVIAPASNIDSLSLHQPGGARVAWIQPVRQRLRLFAQPLDWFAALTGLLAVLAILLGTTGLVVLTGEMVQARRREIAVRMALGATPAAVHGWVLRRGLAAATTGVLIGLPAARAVAVLLRELPNQSSDADVAQLALAAAGFVLLGMVSSWRAGARAVAIPPAALWATRDATDA